MAGEGKRAGEVAAMSCDSSRRVALDHVWRAMCGGRSRGEENSSGLELDVSSRVIYNSLSWEIRPVAYL